MIMDVKKLLSVGLCCATLFSFSACQQNPDSSIVKNKNMDSLIEQATGGDGADVFARQYDTYKTTIQDDALHVTVNVDAQVDIPQTEHMSVFRIRQRQITNELIAKAKVALIGDLPLYDGEYLNVHTKADIGPNLSSIRKLLDEEKAAGGDNISAYQYEYDLCLAQYEAAPDRAQRPSSPNDGKLKSVRELYYGDPDNSYYKWLYTLGAEGDTYYGVNQDESGNYDSLFVRNNPDRGNMLRFRRSPLGYEGGPIGGGYSAVMPTENGDDGSVFLGAKTAAQIESSFSFQSTYGDSLIDTTVTLSPETCSLSKEDAADRAKQVLSALGLDSYELFDGDVITERGYSENDFCYRVYYLLIYKQNHDGAFLNNAGGKYSESWSGGSFSKKEWEDETVVFRVNDSGVVGFDLNSPIEITDTVVANAALRSFDDVKATFEKMITVTNADERETCVVDVRRVRLGYCRISEADSWDTGLLVPVWDFFGSEKYLAEDGNYYDRFAEDGAEYCVMSVNAIDNSIIDHELGY